MYFFLDRIHIAYYSNGCSNGCYNCNEYDEMIRGKIIGHWLGKYLLFVMHTVCVIPIESGSMSFALNSFNFKYEWFWKLRALLVIKMDCVTWNEIFGVNSQLLYPWFSKKNIIMLMEFCRFKSFFSYEIYEEAHMYALQKLLNFWFEMNEKKCNINDVHLTLS